jgi:hypothetical protein
VKLRLNPIYILFLFSVLSIRMTFAQFPESVICKFEKISTAELDSSSNIITGSETSTGELVISNLNSDSPLGSGNIGAVKLQVLRKTKDIIWLVELNTDEVASFITLFFKSGIVMQTKHEILSTLYDGAKPFGFVEIGRFRPLK